MATNNKKLAILGSYPPPSGGVAEHSRRLCSLLKKRGIDYTVYNAASESECFQDNVVSVFKNRRFWMAWFFLFGKESAVCIMSPRLSSWFVGCFLAKIRGKKVVVRVQNSRVIDWCKKSKFKKWLTGLTLSGVTGIICVNEAIAKSIKEVGVDPKKVFVVPGFLPPVAEDFKKENVSSEVWRFIDVHMPLILANGKISFYNNQDLYGIDHCVELAWRLKSDYENIGVLFCLSDFSVSDEKYLEEIYIKAEKNGVKNNLLFNKKYGPLIPILSVSDLFVRPTNTDGDANSIRESLFLGVPVVASDVVERPKGTHVFSTRDMDQFEKTVRSVLNSVDCNQKIVDKLNNRMSLEDNMRITSYVDILESITLGKEFID